MTASSMIAAQAYDGTAALETRTRPHLVLIEGGLSHEACRRAERPVRLSLGQRVCAALCCTLVIASLCVASLVADALVAVRRTQTLDQLPERTVIVDDGDTLWGIAESLGVDDVPTRDIVTWITERNGTDAALVAGQSLVVPSAVLG